jgi:hypothetical protein
MARMRGMSARGIYYRQANGSKPTPTPTPTPKPPVSSGNKNVDEVTSVSTGIFSGLWKLFKRMHDKSKNSGKTTPTATPRR